MRIRTAGYSDSSNSNATIIAALAIAVENDAVAAVVMVVVVVIAVVVFFLLVVFLVLVGILILLAVLAIAATFLAMKIRDSSIQATVPGPWLDCASSFGSTWSLGIRNKSPAPKDEAHKPSKSKLV